MTLSSVKTGSVFVDVYPHLVSASLSKAYILNNGSDSSILNVSIRDYNGCGDLSSGSAFVKVDLTAFGNATPQFMAPQSCDGDGITANYQYVGITTSNSANEGAAVIVTAQDASGHAVNSPSDTVFASENLVASTSVALPIKSSAPPTVSVVSLSPSAVSAGNTDLTFQSTETGSYSVYVGASPSCNGASTLVSTGTVNFSATNVVVTVPNAQLSEGLNSVIACVTNGFGSLWNSPTTNVVKDSVAPTFLNTSSPLGVTLTTDPSFSFSATESGAYDVWVNGVSRASGTYSTGGTTVTVTSPNADFVNGDNSVRLSVTDAVGNIGYSTIFNVTKDTTPPSPPTAVSLSDCDFAGNSGTPCAALGNPQSGMNGRDFAISWSTPPLSESGTFFSYDVFVLPSATPFNSGSHVKSVSVANFASTGVLIPASLSVDSAGTPFLSSGSGTYVAHVVVNKSNGLKSPVASSSGAVVVADTIVLPTLVSAAFTSNTGITLTYSGSLSTNLSKYDVSKFGSASACFVFDQTSGTGAKSVSWNTVTFAVQALGDGSIVCNDLLLSSTGAVHDPSGLFNEETFSGKTVIDRQSPTISLTSPTANSTISGSGNFSLVFSNSEALSGATLFAEFTDASGSTVQQSLASKATKGAQVFATSGVSAGLTDGKRYSVRIVGSDIAANASVSNSVSGIVYDVSAPTLPVLSLPSDNGYTKVAGTLFSWAGSTDNYSSGASIAYQIQVSTVADFSVLYVSTSLSGGVLSYPVSPQFTSNTGFYWRVSATDGAGNATAFSAAKRVFFDDAAPVISTLAQDSYSTNVTRSFTGYVKNGDSLQLVSKVTDNYPAALVLTGITANLSPLGGSASANPATFSSNVATWSGLSANCTDGSKSLAVTATDLAGNASTQNVTVVCDNTAPSIVNATISSPSAATYLSGGISKAISWNSTHYSSDLSPLANGLDIEYSTNGGTVWSPIAMSTTNDAVEPWTVPSVDVSNFKVRLKGTDKLGNTSSGIVTFTVDSTNPSVAADALTYPNGWEFLKGSTGTGISILWNPAKISDTNLLANPITLQYSLDSGTNWTTIASGLANNGSYAWTPGALDSNLARIRVVAFDQVGKSSSDASSSDFSIDSVLPTVSVVTPSTPPSLSFLSMSGFDVRVTGADANLDRVSYSFAQGGLYWNSGSQAYIGSQNFNTLCLGSAACADYQGTVFPSIVDGSAYSLVFRSVDKAGNVKDSAALSYQGDLVAPVSTSLISSGTYFSGAVSIAGTATDARSGLSSVKVGIKRLSDNKYWSGPIGGFDQASEFFVVTTTSNAYTNWSYTGFTIPAGDAEGSAYEITILWIDKAYKANNESRNVLSIFKDSVGPVLASDVWTNPQAGDFWNGLSARTVSWTPAKISDAHAGVSATGSVKLEYSTGAAYVLIADGLSNSGTYVWNAPAIDADVTFRLSSVDRIGNVSAAGVVSPMVTIDSLPPLISTVSTMDQAAAGKIDALLVTMSEPVKCSTVLPQNFNISGVGAATAISACSGNSSTFVVEFAATGDTATKPSLTYTAGSLADRAWNALSTVAKSSTDGAVPRLVSSSLSDTNSDGKIDRVTANFSETMQSSTDVTAWTLNGAPAGVGTAPVSVFVSANSAILTLTAPTAFETSTGGMSVSFLSNSNWKDSTNSVAGSKIGQSLTDLAAPKAVSVVTVDNAGFYAVDVTFSETLSGSSLSGFSIGGSATYSGAYVSTGPKSYRFITADSSAADTQKALTYSYVPGILKDPYGNSLAAVSSTPVYDGIAPKILSRITKDADRDGKIDSILLVLSESNNANVTGVSATVSGYSTVGYSAAGTGLTVSVAELSSFDTQATPTVQISNTSFADPFGNSLVSDASAVLSVDGVGPVVTAARYDGNNKIVVTLSEPFSGTPLTSWFVLSGSAVSSSAAATYASNEIELTVAGTVTPGTTEVSTASGLVADAIGNKQSGTYFSKVNSSVVINEVMWSNSGSSLTQYIELRNVGAASVDISNFKLDFASTNGTATLTLPPAQSIAAGGIYLIAASAVSNASNLLSASVFPNFVGALSLSNSQVSSIVLKNPGNSVYDRAKANPWAAGSDSGVVSMERKSTPGDGLSAANWYPAHTGGAYFDSAIPKGTPGAANVFDSVAPVIGVTAPADNKLFASGTGIVATFAYSDAISMDSSPQRTFKLEKNDGAGTYIDTTATGVVSSGATSASANYSFAPLARGAYRTTFSVSDTAGNQAQKISNFYVDGVSVTISSPVSNVGTLVANVTGRTLSPVTVTVRTVGAPFVLTLWGSGTLSAGYDTVSAWNGSEGFGFDCSKSGNATAALCDGAVRSISGTVLETVATASPDVNGNLKTYVYNLSFDSKVDAFKTAGSYSGSVSVVLVPSY